MSQSPIGRFAFAAAVSVALLASPPLTAEAAETLLSSMDAVVDLLAGLDYPDGMTSGLRRTTDVARSLVERSRADLTASVVQERLRSELASHLDG